MIESSPTAPEFRFMPCAHSWVALHPNPKGIIQFIGGAFWGTFPTVFYRHFLKSLFEAGYTIVAIPFRFTFQHWSVALSLLDEHYAVRIAIIEAAITHGYDPTVYLETVNYTWIGHSLGCKYVALLELLSEPIAVLTGYLKALEPKVSPRQVHQIQHGLACLKDQLRHLEGEIQRMTGQVIHYGRPSIENERSLLLAPAITALDGAIPIKSLQTLLARLVTVSPTTEQTHGLIERSQLFKLTGIIQFARDTLSAGTCWQLMQEQPHIRRRLVAGNHLEPVGIQMGQFIVDLNPTDKFVQPLGRRDLEAQTMALLAQLGESAMLSKKTVRPKKISMGKAIAA